RRRTEIVRLRRRSSKADNSGQACAVRTSIASACSASTGLAGTPLALTLRAGGAAPAKVVREGELRYPAPALFGRSVWFLPTELRTTSPVFALRRRARFPPPAAFFYP